MRLFLKTRVDAAAVLEGHYDEVVLATGVTPRRPDLDGADHAKALGYLDVLRDDQPVGATVAIVGAGGIGFDVAEALTQAGSSASVEPSKFYAEWGIDTGYAHRGGLQVARPGASPRVVHLLQRKTTKVGEQLGKTTGWIHRAGLKARGVRMESAVAYRRIDDDGLHVTVDGKERTLAVDQVVLCAGQEPLRDLYDSLKAAGCRVHLVGGADVAAELDAKRAIQQGTTLGASI